MHPQPSNHLAHHLHLTPTQARCPAVLTLPTWDHARFACVQAAGISIDDLIGNQLGPVNLQTVINYHHELRGGDQVEVSCDWEWGSGKTYRVHHLLRRLDGTLAAEVSHVSGLLNLETRRLITNPDHQWRARADKPELLGLGTS